MRRRAEFKREVAKMLDQPSVAKAATRLALLPQRRVVSSLISHLNGTDFTGAARAADILGRLAALWITEQAEQGRESAREVMRRLMWSLNEESGSIGWGAPRAMAEIMSRDQFLAAEYINILSSYISEGDNFLEYEPLQREVLWGLGLLANARPDLTAGKGLSSHLLPLLNSPDAGVRGLAAHLLGLLGHASAASQLEKLTEDKAEFISYQGGRSETISVGQLARRGLQASDGLDSLGITTKGET